VIKSFLKKHQEKNLLLINYLLVLYAFFLPISNFFAKNIFSIALVLTLFLPDIKQRVIYALKNRVVQAFLFFYLIHFIWMIGSEQIDVAIFKVKNFRYILYIILFVAVVKDEFKLKILNSFIFAILFSEIMSYNMLFHIKIPFIKLNGYSHNVPFMQAYTQYSVVLSIALGLILYKVFSEKKLWMKLFYFIFLSSASINIFIIESKLGYGLYFLSIFTALVFILKKNFTYKKIVFVVLFVTAGYWMAYNYSSTFHNRINHFKHSIVSLYKSKNFGSSTGVRAYYYIQSFEMIRKDPKVLFFGYGTGDHIEEFKSFFSKHNIKYKRKILHPISGGKNASLHSEYLDNLLQFGLIGLFSFLYIFYTILKTKTKYQIFSLLKYILVVVYLVNSTVSVIFIHTTIGKVFVLLSSLIIPSYKKRDT